MTWAGVTIPPGLARTATAYDTPSRWWDCNLIRWQAGNIIPVGGWQRLTGSPASAIIRKIHGWADNTGNLFYAIGRNNGIDIFTDNFVDVTPASFVSLDGGTGGGYGALLYGDDFYGTARASQPVQFSFPPAWTIANFGQDILALASSDGRLFHWAPALPPVLDMDVPSNAPISSRAMTVTAERMVMLAGSGGLPRRVSWSNREDYNDWNFASTTGTAGYLDLEVSGPITMLRRVKEGVLVLSQREAYLMRYVGQPFIYAQERLGKTTFNAPNAIATAGSFCVWLGDECFWIYDGGAVRPLDCPIFNDIHEEFDRTGFGPANAHMSDNGVFPEIWLFYPSTASVDGECDRYVIWNYAENWWARGSLQRTAMFSPGPSVLPFMAGVDKHIYQHEDGWTDNGATRVGSVWAESAVLDAASGAAQVKSIRQMSVATDPNTANAFRVSLKSRFTSSGAETTFGPYTPRADGYVDTRATGRDLRVRVEATQDSFWSFGQLRMDVTQSGANR